MVKKTNMIDEGDEGTRVMEERRFGEEGWIGEEQWILGLKNPKILPLSLSSLLTCQLNF
jgi:hypothetical protein